MKKLSLIIVLTLVQSGFPVGVVCRISNNDVIAIGDVTAEQFIKSDVSFTDIPESKIAKPPTGNSLLGIKMLICNPGNQSVDLRPQLEQDNLNNQYSIQQDVLQIIQLRAYLVAGTQLGNLVASQAVKDQIAIATNTLSIQIQAIVAKH